VSNLTVENPQRWSIESPTLYRLKSTIQVNLQAVDESATTFGFRTLTFDPDNGFFLNDRSVKLKGLCIHHDAGCVGAAVPDKVLERRLRLLKELGCNAIRTSHNPPAPELLDICDRMGLLVQDEAFDEFTPPKNKWVDGWNAGIPSRCGQFLRLLGPGYLLFLKSCRSLPIPHHRHASTLRLPKNSPHRHDS